MDLTRHPESLAAIVKQENHGIDTTEGEACAEEALQQEVNLDLFGPPDILPGDRHYEGYLQ